jgi:hypothetical protein
MGSMAQRTGHYRPRSFGQEISVWELSAIGLSSKFIKISTTLCLTFLASDLFCSSCLFFSTAINIMGNVKNFKIASTVLLFSVPYVDNNDKSEILMVIGKNA